jgi:hypothetical protein
MDGTRVVEVAQFTFTPAAGAVLASVPRSIEVPHPESAPRGGQR